MLIRLLVAVLTLAGPIPLRVCTCAAAHAAPAPESHAAPHGPAIDGAESHAHADCCDESHQPTQHERECPAANPRPLVREAVSPAASDAPSDYSSQVAVVETPPLAGPRLAAPSARQSTRTSNTPLYLTLLTLRN